MLSTKMETYQTGVNSGFFNVLCHSSHKGSSVLKVGVKVGLIDYGTSLSFYAWLLIRKRQLVQHFHVRQRVGKCHLFRGHFQERQPLGWTIVIKISERNLGFMEETKTLSQHAIHFIRQTTPFWLTLLSKVLVFIYSRWRCTKNKNKFLQKKFLETKKFNSFFNSHITQLIMNLIMFY